MSNAHALLEQAVRLHQSGDLARAEALYRQVLQTQPQQPDALHLLGVIAHQSGQHQRAVELISQAIALNPKVPAYHLNQANALRSAGRVDDAIKGYQDAIRLKPDIADAHFRLGNAYKAQNQFQQAILSLREALRLQPNRPEALLNLGVALLEIHRLDEAVAAFREALQWQPNRPEAHNILGHALHRLGKLGEATSSFREALRLDPRLVDAHNNLASVLKAQGQMDEALAEYRNALTLQPESRTHSNLLLALNFTPSISPDEVFREHQRWNDLHAATWRGAKAPLVVGQAGHRPLRVGYVSPDFINHSVAYFIEPVIATHDRSQFEVICYSDVRVPDAVTRRIRSQATVWRDIANYSDEELAAQIREDQIDILVDLSGHTAGNRLLVFARKPAPIQMTWIGYPNTTGLDAIDYRITDALADPSGQTEALHSETLLRLPENFSCYRPADDSPEVGPLPALANGYVTFGCFNNFAKVTSEWLAVWANILKADPASRLLLKAKGLAEDSTRQALFDRFSSLGIAAERLELNGDELPVAGHLSLYHRVDVALDTFPYHGTTTTCEALWMGVPVIALAGRTHVSRVGVSLLSHLGAPEWIAHSPEDYVTKATNLAMNRNALATLRSQLRARMRQSPLCNAARFTQNLEAAYRQAWQAKCSDRS